MTTEQVAATTDEGTEPSVDVDALTQALDAAGAEAQASVDLANIKRAIGHIPELQKSLNSVSKEIAKVGTLERTVASQGSRLEALINNLPDGLIPASAAAMLRPAAGDTNADLDAKLAALRDELTPKPAVTPDEDPAQAVWRAQLAAAQETVSEYSKKNSFDVSTIPDAVYTRALAANGNNVSQATLDVIKYIDTQTAAAKRRGERVDAGSGGVGARAARSGPVTAEQMKTMTVAEIRAIPMAERMAALGG